jgi:hypothetical protein
MPIALSKFGFIAKHRGIWPVGWLCKALGVSRGGFYAWLTRPLSQRSRSDEEPDVKVRGSFLASSRTYGVRRVWCDLLKGVSCGLRRIERLMRLQARKARPRRRRLPPDLGPSAAAANVLNRTFDLRTLGIEIVFNREGRLGTRTIRITAMVNTVPSAAVSDDGHGAGLTILGPAWNRCFNCADAADGADVEYPPTQCALAKPSYKRVE